LAMGRTVLVALDGSSHSLRALRWYIENNQVAGDSLLLLFISEPPSMMMSAGAATPEVYMRCKEEAVAKAKQLAAEADSRCAEWGIRADISKRFLERLHSGPGPTIVSVANEESVDLIVMGSRGLGTLRRTFLGSVSDYVLHHAHKPCAIIPPPAAAVAASSAEATAATVPK
ncbi:hypothetical protein BOX15_Mlig014986g2, partial [Macrostomum lignano]